MKGGWQAVVVQTLQAQRALLHDSYRQHQHPLERLLASQDRQLALIEEQNALVRASERVHSQRREAAAIQSFGLDHENIEIRQRIRELEAQLAADTGAAAAEPLPF